jgi:hypothetical protein
MAGAQYSVHARVGNRSNRAAGSRWLIPNGAVVGSWWVVASSWDPVAHDQAGRARPMRRSTSPTTFAATSTRRSSSRRSATLCDHGSAAPQRAPRAEKPAEYPRRVITGPRENDPRWTAGKRWLHMGQDRPERQRSNAPWRDQHGLQASARADRLFRAREQRVPLCDRRSGAPPPSDAAHVLRRIRTDVHYVTGAPARRCRAASNRASLVRRSYRNRRSYAVTEARKR